MNVECPKCDRDHKIDGEELSDFACDDEEFECHNEECLHVFTIGWYATVEVRQDRLKVEIE